MKCPSLLVYIIIIYMYYTCFSCRYFIGKALNHSCHGGRFPLGTFCSNIVAATSLALMGHSSPKTLWGNLFHEVLVPRLIHSREEVLASTTIPDPFLCFSIFRNCRHLQMAC